MNKQPRIIANWKMELSVEHALAWISQNKQELEELAQKSALVLCPDFCALYPARELLKDTRIKLGAQSCSEHARGTFTGQVSAQSLQEAGATYCLVGHAEVRTCGETDAAVAQKVAQLIKCKITPIVCIGETAREREQQKTHLVLEQQLVEVLKMYASTPQLTTLLIAYEPIWAIGSSQAITNQELATVILAIKTICERYRLAQALCILYGGSVTIHNARELVHNTGIDGFLIGRASLDFQNLKKIVLSTLGETFNSGV